MLVAMSSLLVAMQVNLDPILARVSEEAEVFQQTAPKIIGVERLESSGRRAPSRFKILLGGNAVAPRYTVKVVVSEYGFGAFREAPEALRELRQVVSVDGRKVSTPEKARETLARNMSSEDDRQRKRLLQEFESYGTIGATTDLGQMLLLFRRRQLSGYEFSFGYRDQLQGEECLVLRYRQLDSPDTASVFTQREMIRIPLAGELWVRERDSLPVRITMNVQLQEEGRPVEHRAVIDYGRTRHGVLLPSTVRYSKETEGRLVVENTHTYSDYKKFGADTEIRFTPTEEPE